VETKRAILLDVEQVLENPVLVPRHAVWRQAHNLVFARVDLESSEVSEGRVQESQRMREEDLFMHLDIVSLPYRRGSRRPLSDSVHREYYGLLKRRRKERARCMAEMVLAEEQFLVPAFMPTEFPQFVLQQVFQEELFPQPQRDCHAKRLESARRE